MYRLDEKIRREGGLEGCLISFFKIAIIGFIKIAVICGAINLIIYLLKNG